MIVPPSPGVLCPYGDATTCLRDESAARSAGLPVVFTRVSYQPGGADGGLFIRKIPSLRVSRRAVRSATPPPAHARSPGKRW